MEQTDKRVDVSIVFVNYNTVALLVEAIQSVIDKTQELNYEIIVVDNNSSDNSQQILAHTFGDKVVYISLSENVGFGRANNVGFGRSMGRNVLCLNPDTLLINHAIKELSDYLDAHPHVGVVGSQLYNKDGSLQQSYSSHYLSLSSKINDLFGSLFRRKHTALEKPMSVASVFGASMMIRREVVERTKGFNPKFFMYAEEEEWCYRIHKLGYKIMCIPQSKVTHLDGGSFQFSQDRTLRRVEGCRTFYKEVYSPWYYVLVKAVDYLMIVTRIAAFGLMGNKEKVKYWKFMYRNRL